MKIEAEQLTNKETNQPKDREKGCRIRQTQLYVFKDDIKVKTVNKINIKKRS